MIHKVCNTKETQLLQKLIIEDAIASMEEYPSENNDGLLTETGIVLGKENYGGQVVILAGGAGSGKSFVKDNLLLIKGRTFDLDEIKRLIIEHPKSGLYAKFEKFFQDNIESMGYDSTAVLNDMAMLQRFKEYLETQHGIELRMPKELKLYAQENPSIFKDFIDLFKNEYQTSEGYRVGNQKDIYTSNLLNTFAKQKDTDGRKLLHKMIDDFFKSLNSSLLPNLLFDRTLKDRDDVIEVASKVAAVGYRPENIHIIWVLTPVEVALKNNTRRNRKVVPMSLEETHNQVAKNMYNILVEEPNFIRENGVDGVFLIVFNNRDAKDIDTAEMGVPWKNHPLFYIKGYRRIEAKNAKKPIKSLPDSDIKSIREYAPNFQ